MTICYNKVTVCLYTFDGEDVCHITFKSSMFVAEITDKTVACLLHLIGTLQAPIRMSSWLKIEP